MANLGKTFESRTIVSHFFDIIPYYFLFSGANLRVFIHISLVHSSPLLVHLLVSVGLEDEKVLNFASLLARSYVP